MTAEVEPEDAEVTYQWLANGVEIPGATDATLKVKEDYIGQQLSVTVTAEDGEEATSEETAPVTNDKSAEIKLNDRNGLQPDGTALPTDTLDVAYGADLGTPRIIIWYCNGAAVDVYSLDGGGIGPGAFNSATIAAAAPVAGELPAGDYWVTIENTAGQVAVTNVITVAANERAIMTDFSIEDAYGDSTATKILTDKPDEAIINVTFNKMYTGNLYVNEVSNETYTAAKMVGTTGAAYTGIAVGGLTKKTKASDFTNKNAGKVAGKGIYYVESDGTFHAKIVVPAAVTRGTDYELIFDQDDVVGDELGAKVEKDDLNVTTPATVPYVVAPDSIAVTSFSNGTAAPQVTFYDESGEAMEWLTQTATATSGISSVKVFGVDNNVKSTSDVGVNPTAWATKDGVFTLTMGSGVNHKYAYVTMKTEAGIFAEKSETFESEISETAIAALDSISIKEDSTNPEAAVITLKGLSSKAPGTVYIQQGAANAVTNWTDIATKDNKDAIASAHVDGATASVTIDGVFKSKYMTATAIGYNKTTGGAVPVSTSENRFVAVFVPDDTELWLSKNSLDADTGKGFELTPVISGSDKTDMTATLTAVTDAVNGAGDGTNSGNPADFAVTVTGIQLLDQFGDKWVGAARTTDAVAASASKVVVTNTESASGTVTSDAAGIVTLIAHVSVGDKDSTSNTTKFFDKGETFTYKVSALKDLTVTVGTKHALWADTNMVVDTTDAGAKPTGATTNTVKSGASMTNAADANSVKLAEGFSVS